MFGTFHVRTSIVLVLMMLLAGLSPIGLDSEIRLSDSGRLISEVNSTAFLDGNTSVVLNPDDAEFVDIAHESGHRLVSGSVDLSVSPTQSTSSQSVSLIGQSGLGDMVNLTERPGGLELVDAATGPPGAGLNSVTVWGNLSLNGTHAYNVLEVWGNLTTAASLELVVRRRHHRHRHVAGRFHQWLRCTGSRRWWPRRRRRRRRRPECWIGRKSLRQWFRGRFSRRRFDQPIPRQRGQRPRRGNDHDPGRPHHRQRLHHRRR